MSNVLIEKNKLDVLATAISNKSGEPLKLTLDEMVEAVDGIENNPAPTLQAKTYTVDSAGTETITADSGYDGLSSVAVNVPAADPYFGAESGFYTDNNVRKWRFRGKTAVYNDDGYSEGYIGQGDYYGTWQVRNAVPSNTTITPTTSAQTIGGANYMMEGAVTVNAVPQAFGANGDIDITYFDDNNQRWARLSPWTYYQFGYVDGETDGIPINVNAIPTGTTVTPTESAQTIGGADTMMEGAVTVSAIPSNYVGSGITQRSSSDLTANGATVTVPSGYYSAQASKSVASGTAGTPTATKGTVSNHSVSVTPSVTNTTGYITGSTKTGTAVTVSASELVSGSETKTTNGTYDVTNLAELVVDVSGGGSSTIQVGKTAKTLSATASSIQFTGLSGNPTSFVITSSADIATNTDGVTAVVYDGTSLHGQTMTTQVTADTGFTKSYSSGTLTVTATTAEFQANEYKLVYTYDGTSSDIHTSDVQVGSGATSITFSSLAGRPIYWSCIFKSNFSTSSGYQRVVSVANDGTSIYGMAMDSSAKAQTSWTATYSGGDLTISSSGTNNGGYFHQPGYYQLTYAVDLSAPQYQTKTVSPSTSQQTVTADSGYDALEEVIVNAMPSMTLPSSTSATSSGTSKATISASSSTQYLNIPTGYNATAQYYTISASGGGGGANIATETTTNSSNQNTSINFTLPSGRTPKAFFARLTSQIARNSNSRYYYVFDMRWDGSSTGGVAGNTFYMSSGTLTNVTSGYSYSQSGTTFTLSSTGSRSASPGSFYNGTYELVYIY